MAVTVEQVAVELGKDPSTLTPLQRNQYESWILRATHLIVRRCAMFNKSFAQLDPNIVDEVVLLAVARRARQPQNGATSYGESVTVDDITIRQDSKYAESSTYGDLWFADEWWSWLGLTDPEKYGWCGSLRYTR